MTPIAKLFDLPGKEWTWGNNTFLGPNLLASSPFVQGKSSGGSILKLHEDVQTCGYKDVQVMFEMLTSELEDPKRRKQQQAASWRPPSAWPSRSSSSIAAAAQ
ncbi:hypothetical protein TRIUR3_31103 [Triticum urartu]|uniref:Uncharacterized protein n=2 Tax=Triticum TaxID=4564 RepID=A0A9R1P3X0_TRITD|nr:hypothetical protein TRIUR3_31103 [Triticum urartu]VAH36152.1 unnamed protein product [Triticum turgidum subsp. durum]